MADKSKPKASVFVRRAEKLHKRERMICECREVAYEIFTEKEQEVLAGWSARIAKRIVLTVKQGAWLDKMWARACAYDERGGRD